MDIMVNYLKMLVEELHSAIVATIGTDGHPQTRVIDMMLWDENGVYFLTAKGKAFYTQLLEQQYIALSAVKDKRAVSLRGKARDVGSYKLDEIFEKNTYMQGIYPGDNRSALEVFQIYEAQGEYFDITDPSHVVRDQGCPELARFINFKTLSANSCGVAGAGLSAQSNMIANKPPSIKQR